MFIKQTKHSTNLFYFNTGNPAIKWNYSRICWYNYELVKKFLQMGNNKVFTGCATKNFNNATIHSNTSHYLFQFDHFIYTVALFIKIKTPTPK
jgi:hypothetical protein